MIPDKRELLPEPTLTLPTIAVREPILIEILISMYRAGFLLVTYFVFLDPP
jgi:hypothetical protein